MSGFQFSVSALNLAQFGPRIGKVTLTRPGSDEQAIDTPGLLTSTSRGVIPHLSRDHHRHTKAIQWVHVPFESFLEHLPPIPTLQPGDHPLHKFLGFVPARHILSMSIRDPSDGREMPPNGNTFVSAYCLRGVRKVPPTDWRTYVDACQPDIVVALSDTPFTDPPYSQKRLTKSLERSSAWLSDILHLAQGTYRPNVFVHMAGGASIPARAAFSHNLMETLYGKEAEAITPFKCLDEGVAGYTFDLVPLRLSLEAAEKGTMAHNESTPAHQIEPDITIQSGIRTGQLIPLLQASLNSLPSNKLRVANSVRSPHEILRLIRSVGIDVFDAHWAQKAADIGIALDFRFPITGKGEEQRRYGRRDLGHNLYNIRYAHDFSSLANSFSGATSSDSCPCTACSPMVPSTRVSHAALDAESFPSVHNDSNSESKPSFTRAYVHHLLHTHEMSAHSLLVMHNLTVLDAFFAGVRSVLSQGNTKFEQQLDAFIEEYDEELVVFDEARISWSEVEFARGKGRLAREKAKEGEATLGTAVQV